MNASATLTIDAPRQLEHELFRACMQLVVGVEQRHSRNDAYARRLRELAMQYIGPDAWVMSDGTQLSECKQIWGN